MLHCWLNCQIWSSTVPYFIQNYTRNCVGRKAPNSTAFAITLANVSKLLLSLLPAEQCYKSSKSNLNCAYVYLENHSTVIRQLQTMYSTCTINNTTASMPQFSSNTNSNTILPQTPQITCHIFLPLPATGGENITFSGRLSIDRLEATANDFIKLCSSMLWNNSATESRQCST